MSLLALKSQRWLSSASGCLDQVACLKDVRSVLRLSGPTLIHFLQGLLTNDVTLLEKPNPNPLYSCILNAQGRYLHDLFLHPLSSITAADGASGEIQSTPTLLLDIDSYGKNDLLRLLKRYRLREKIQIDDVSEEWHVWTQFGDQNNDNENNSQQWPRDPRLPCLGYRTLLPASSSTPTDLSLDSNTNNTTSTDSSSSKSVIVPWDEYRRWRISLGVAEGDQEIPSGDAIALEYNIDQGGLHGISFTKGCYVGQELMARTHFKGVVRKRIMPVHFGGGNGGDSNTPTSSATVGENIIDSDSGKVFGSLRVIDTEARQGLALLRLKEAHEAIDGGRVLKTEYGGVEIVPRRPTWWPHIWGREQ